MRDTTVTTPAALIDWCSRDGHAWRTVKDRRGLRRQGSPALPSQGVLVLSLPIGCWGDVMDAGLNMLNFVQVTDGNSQRVAEATSRARLRADCAGTSNSLQVVITCSSRFGGIPSRALAECDMALILEPGTNA
jgi:hypothetical protein